MRARQIRISGCRLCGPLSLATVVLVGLTLTGCGSSAAKAAGPVRCGTSRTAANTPVIIDVASGRVACSTALTVERDYTKAIRDGKAAGNGGGGPVHVDGWICQGYATPQVLKTGRTSKCVKGSTELVAILDVAGSS
jgi:hypothetical protein